VTDTILSPTNNARG